MTLKEIGDYKKEAIKEVKSLKTKLSDGIWLNIIHSNFNWDNRGVNGPMDYVIIGRIKALCLMFNLKDEDINDLRIGQTIVNELFGNLEIWCSPKIVNVNTNKLFNMSDAEFKCRYVK